MTTASSALTVWYFADLESHFARLCGILVTSAECTGERFVQIKQRKASCCILVKIWS